MNIKTKTQSSKTIPSNNSFKSSRKMFSQNLKVCQFVLLKDVNDNFISVDWYLGKARIILIYKGDYGHLRITDIKTTTGYYVESSLE